MSKKINIEEILDKHIGAYSVKFPSYLHKAYKAAIKEIVEAVVKNCSTKCTNIEEKALVLLEATNINYE